MKTARLLPAIQQPVDDEDPLANVAADAGPLENDDPPGGLSSVDVLPGHPPAALVMQPNVATLSETVITHVTAQVAAQVATRVNAQISARMDEVHKRMDEKFSTQAPQVSSQISDLGKKMEAFKKMMDKKTAASDENMYEQMSAWTRR